MGWNSWNSFKCDVSEDLMIEMMERMINNGYVDLGYNYLNLDDCWASKDRNSDGQLEADPEKFPSGIKYLSSHIQQSGLYFGIYSCAGTQTCAKYPASLNYETTDANTFAEWGVNYLKYDNCFNDSVPGTKRYQAMSQALNQTDSPIFFSMCNWGEEESWKWAPQIANSWRTTQDIFNGWASVEQNFLINQQHADVSGPGAWNDPDMLEVGVHDGKGHYGLTLTEERTHFAMWALAKAPLIIGADLSNIRQESVEILQNKDLIAVNQDLKSRQATCYIGCTSWHRFWRLPAVYVTSVSDGSIVANVINFRETTFDGVSFELGDIGVILTTD